MHSTNGNRLIQKLKPYKDDVDVLQINAGNDMWDTSEPILINTVSQHKPKILVVSESNFPVNDPEAITSRRISFPKYKFVDKVLPGNDVARLTILIDEEIDFERCSSLENEINSTAVIKIRRSHKKYEYFIGNYRQWQGTSSLCSYSSRRNEDSKRDLKI